MILRELDAPNKSTFLSVMGIPPPPSYARWSCRLHLYMYICREYTNIFIYIYILIYREGERKRKSKQRDLYVKMNLRVYGHNRYMY